MDPSTGRIVGVAPGEELQHAEAQPEAPPVVAAYTMRLSPVDLFWLRRVGELQAAIDSYRFSDRDPSELVGERDQAMAILDKRHKAALKRDSALQQASAWFRRPWIYATGLTGLVFVAHETHHPVAWIALGLVSVAGAIGVLL